MRHNQQQLAVTDVLGITDADIKARVKASLKRPPPKVAKIGDLEITLGPRPVDYDGAVVELLRERLTPVVRRGAWCSLGHHFLTDREPVVLLKPLGGSRKHETAPHRGDIEIACRACYGPGPEWSDYWDRWGWTRGRHLGEEYEYGLKEVSRLWHLREQRTCDGCGRALAIYHFPNRGRRLWYCSERCRGRVVGGHPQVTLATCAQCGKEYRPARSDARYCSGACRQKAHRDRHRAA